MSLEQVTIREIQQKDNEQLAKVIRKVLLEMGMPKVGTAYADASLDDMYNSYRADDKVYFVVEDNDEITGGAGIAQLENYDGKVCELQKMYFLPKSRGKGIGYRLLEICLDAARKLGYDKCYLETMPYMEDARKLYRKFGFKAIENPMGDTGHYACQVWMIKDL